MVKKLFSRKATILTLGIAFIICFFLGSFANAPKTMDQSFDGKYWYYINRGYPVAWAGIALTNSQIEFPLVKMPFLTRNNDGKEFVKIIDLKIFTPLLLITFFLSYLPAFIFAKAVNENKHLLIFFVIVNVIVLAIALFIYFSVFSIL